MVLWELLSENLFLGGLLHSVSLALVGCDVVWGAVGNSLLAFRNFLQCVVVQILLVCIALHGEMDLSGVNG